jgi:hypothetical protein
LAQHQVPPQPAAAVRAAEQAALRGPPTAAVIARPRQPPDESESKGRLSELRQDASSAMQR